MLCIETTDPRSKGYGHQYVTIGRGKGYELYAHRAAFMLAWGSIPPGLSVRHTCDNRACINPMHLQLGTHAQNMADVKVRRRWAKPWAKVTWVDVRDIRERDAEGVTRAVIAVEYGLAQSTVSRIITGRTWKERVR
jgi:hypothetical protein